MAIRRIQEKLPQRTILWEFVNLVESDPLRRVKLRFPARISPGSIQPTWRS